MTACSESSSSGGGATAPDNPANPITPADTATNNTNTPEKVYLFGDIEKVAYLYVAPVIKEFYSSDLVWNGSTEEIKNELVIANQEVANNINLANQISNDLKNKGLLNINVDDDYANNIYIYAYALYNESSYSIKIWLYCWNHSITIRTTVKKM